MSAPTEDRGQRQHPVLGDLSLWYPAFEVYAATAPPDNAHFHGPHVAAPADLDRVWLALQWFEDRYGDALGPNALPDLGQLQAEIKARGHVGGRNGVADDGSPCHNFWHWVHGA
jgi:hypothetical protein